MIWSRRPRQKEDSCGPSAVVQPSDQQLNVHPTEVDCDLAVVCQGPERLPQLSTSFGSDDRATGRKSSESLQLDVEQVGRLIEIIEVAFPEVGGH